MRFCNSCHRITVGEPLFCNFCGRTYDLKLCPARHINPRSASVCSQCGSHELSSPHTRLSLARRILWKLLKFLPGLLLILLTAILLLLVLHELLTNAVVQGQVVALGAIVGCLWWAYLQLPGFIRKGVKRVTRGRTGGGGHGH
jgi:RNA polymerase subunit RPABC4/transcription elongation factor Spt4